MSTSNKEELLDLLLTTYIKGWNDACSSKVQPPAPLIKESIIADRMRHWIKVALDDLPI